MSNCCVITTNEKKIGVYMHWNGGYDTIHPVLEYCKRKGYRGLDEDNYGFARLCQVLGNLIGGTLSVGVGPYDELDTDNGDNGVYVVKGWDIVGREFFSGPEQDEYDFDEVLHAIDAEMPENERIFK